MIPRTPRAIDALHDMAQSAAREPEAEVPTRAQCLADMAGKFGIGVGVFLIVWFAAHLVKGLLA